jgi:hypothetical protein
MMIHKVVLMLSLGLTCGLASAEWVAVGESDSLISYVDYSTIRKSGNMVKMWSIYDYKHALEGFAGKKFLSTKSRDEYDCIEEKARRISLSVFSGNIGQGEAIYTDSFVNGWVDVAPDSIGKTLWDIACGKEEANLKSN